MLVKYDNLVERSTTNSAIDLFAEDGGSLRPGKEGMESQGAKAKQTVTARGPARRGRTETHQKYSGRRGLHRYEDTLSLSVVRRRYSPSISR